MFSTTNKLKIPSPQRGKSPRHSKRLKELDMNKILNTQKSWQSYLDKTESKFMATLQIESPREQ